MVKNAMSSVVTSLIVVGGSQSAAATAAATASRESDPASLDEAVGQYRRFEERSSEYAVWLLTDIGHDWATGPYTSFLRADIEAMTLFHRSGRAPRWAEFYSQWKRLGRSREVWIKPFTPRPIPSFTPVAIPKQEVLQAP